MRDETMRGEMMSRVSKPKSVQFPGGEALGVSEPVAARLAGVSHTTFKDLRRAGKGPPYAAVGRRIIYRPADVDAWLQQQSPVRRQNARVPADAGQT